MAVPVPEDAPVVLAHVGDADTAVPIAHRLELLILHVENLQIRQVLDRARDGANDLMVQQDQNKKVRYGKSGVRHMGEMGGWAKRNTRLL